MNTNMNPLLIPEVLKNIFEYVHASSVHSLLEIRSVCKTWNDEAAFLLKYNSYQEKPLKDFTLEFMANDPFHRKTKYPITYLHKLCENSLNIDMLLHTLTVRHRPIFDKMPGTPEFLQAFGQYFQFLKIEFGAIQNLNLLLTSLCPNLTKLKIISFLHPENSESPDICQSARLKIHELYYTCGKESSDHYERVFNSLIKASHELKVLTLRNPMFLAQYMQIMDRYPEVTKNIENITITTTFGVDQISDTRYVHQALIHLADAGFSKKLTSVTIQLNCPYNNSALDNYYNFLRKYGPTLVTLNLVDDFRCNKKDSKDFDFPHQSLQAKELPFMPNLKRLEVSSSQLVLLTFDVLKKMSNLRSLAISDKESCRDEIGYFFNLSKAFAQTPHLKLEELRIEAFIPLTCPTAIHAMSKFFPSLKTFHVVFKTQCVFGSEEIIPPLPENWVQECFTAVSTMQNLRNLTVDLKLHQSETLDYCAAFQALKNLSNLRSLTIEGVHIGESWRVQENFPLLQLIGTPKLICLKLGDIKVQTTNGRFKTYSSSNAEDRNLIDRCKHDLSKLFDGSQITLVFHEKARVQIK